jgi:hypothetical protein
MKFLFHHSVNFIHHNKLTWVILHIKQCRLKNEWISNSIWMDDFPNLVAFFLFHAFSAISHSLMSLSVISHPA